MSNAAAIIKEAREASQENNNAAPGSDPRGRKKPSRLPTIDPPKPKRATSPELNLPQWNRNPKRPEFFRQEPSLRTEEPYRPSLDCVDRGLDPDKNLTPFLRLFRPSDRLQPLGEAPMARAASPRPKVEVPVPKTARQPAAAPAAAAKEPKEAKPKPERSKSAPKQQQQAAAKQPAPPKEGKSKSAAPTRTAAASGPLVLVMPPHSDLQSLFDETDGNGSGALSLAELDKTVKVRWPTLDNKPAIMRAYKAADKDGTGFVTRDEFPYFVQYLVYHNNLFAAFKAADESGDRKLSREEFRELAPGLKIDDADATFDEMDENKGGAIMFDEFCAWIARNRPNMQIDGSIFPRKKASNQPTINKTKVDKKAQQEAAVAEQGAIKITVPPEAECMALFDRLDPNGNGMLSLAELDKGVVELWPKLNNKPAIMRAYKAADRDGSGCVTRKEFGYFLRFLQYYNNLYADFMAADESGDRRITRAELKDAAKGLEIADPDAAFDEMDENKGGYVLFDEFCAWMAKNKSDWGSQEHEHASAGHASQPSVARAEGRKSQPPPSPPPRSPTPAADSIPPTPPKSAASPPRSPTPTKSPQRTPTPPKRTPTPPAAPAVAAEAPPRQPTPPAAAPAAAPSEKAAEKQEDGEEQEESNSSAIVLHDGTEVLCSANHSVVTKAAAGTGTVFAMHQLQDNIGFHFGDRYLTAAAKVGGPVTFEAEHSEGSEGSLRQQWAVEYLEDAVLFMPVCRAGETLDVVNGVVVTNARDDSKATQKCNLRLAAMLESPAAHSPVNAAPPESYTALSAAAMVGGSYHNLLAAVASEVSSAPPHAAAEPHQQAAADDNEYGDDAFETGEAKQPDVAAADAEPSFLTD